MEGPAPGPEDRLYSVSDLPEEYQSVFAPRFQYFNWIQSECFHQLCETDGNMVVGSPTGSGKTVLMELAIVRVLSAHGRGRSPGSLKIVYLAPTHALVNEKHAEWRQCFAGLGLKAVALTRSDILDVAREVQAADIILTTPEKFDAITRKRKSLLMSFFADIALVLIDEVHLLNDDRGGSLEAIVSRLKLVSRIPEMASCGLPISKIRYLAVSATMPNITDVGAWLGCPPQNVKSYGDEMRPVKLRTTVLGYQPCKNDFLFERALNSHIFGVLAQYGKGRQAIVFCASRQDSAKCASAILDRAGNHFLQDELQAADLLREAERLENTTLRQIVRKGVAFHHAGLGPSDRKVVEELFLSRRLVALCSTSTLAYGVNLPAYLVVLKSTRHWSSKHSKYVEYDRSLCLQMAGRAGRPQFEQEGQCVIMTERAKVRRYTDAMGGAEEVESHLLPSIREHLNNEIGLLTVRSASDCEAWLRSTYLGVRIAARPGHYAAQVNVDLRRDGAEGIIREICKRAVEDLSSLEMVRSDPTTGKLEQLEPGRILSHCYLRLDTLKNFQGCRDHLSLEGSLWLVAASAEFDQTVIRRAERRSLNALNAKGSLKFFVPQEGKPDKPLKSLKTPRQKVFLLLQEALRTQASGTALDYGLRCEREEFLRTGPRIAGAAAQYFLHSKQFAAAANCLLLSKSLKQRLWPDSDQHCTQIPGVGQVIANRLVKAGLSRLDDLEGATAQVIEGAAQKPFPFGSKIKSELKKLPPRVGLSLRAKAGSELELTISAKDEAHECTAPNHAWILIGCTATDRILLSERIRLDQLPLPYVTTVPIERRGGGGPSRYVAACIASDFIGRDAHETVDVEAKRSGAAAQASKTGGFAGCSMGGGYTTPPPKKQGLSPVCPPAPVKVAPKTKKRAARNPRSMEASRTGKQVQEPKENSTLLGGRPSRVPLEEGSCFTRRSILRKDPEEAPREKKMKVRPSDRVAIDLTADPPESKAVQDAPSHYHAAPKLDFDLGSIKTMFSKSFGTLPEATQWPRRPPVLPIVSSTNGRPDLTPSPQRREEAKPDPPPPPATVAIQPAELSCGQDNPKTEERQDLGGATKSQSELGSNSQRFKSLAKLFALADYDEPVPTTGKEAPKDLGAASAPKRGSSVKRARPFDSFVFCGEGKDNARGLEPAAATMQESVPETLPFHRIPRD